MSSQQKVAKVEPGTLAKTYQDNTDAKLPAGFLCTACGAKHEFGGWVFAHWHVQLVHTCPCGQKHNLCRGFVRAA